MKNELPYMLADCRDNDHKDCLCVWREDKSVAGYLRRVVDGWEIVDDPKKEIDAKFWEKRVFADPNEAALLVHMQGRAYRAFFDDVEPSTRFEVRVEPRFEAWFATIWSGDRCVGGADSSQSLGEVKYLALRRLYLNDNRSSFGFRRVAQQEWPEVETLSQS
jgi:hypothetical protein